MEKLSGAAPLPPKELSLFKRIVKYYDQKQYKTGLKFANQILSNPKFSEHGETISMKGILLNCLGKKEEARDFVKRGLRSNIQSFVCWHIYGLIMKSDRKYDEAIRCYIQALKLDKNNLQVLRDLSVLQIHTRDIDGCLETRNKLLTQRPNQKASWVGYAVVQHLRGNYDAAATIIYEFLKVQTSVEPYNYEHSELLIYYVTILNESGRYEEALNFMESHAKEIVDKVSYLEIHADLLLKLERFDDAEKDVWLLFERNPDCKPYYELLYQIYEARSKCEMEPSVKRQLLDKCVKQFPSARLPKLLFLETLSGDEFIFHVDVFLRNNLRKGVPTLFVQVKRFYNSEEKRSILENLFLTYRKNLDDHAMLGPVAYGKLEATNSDDELFEPPSTSLWLNYLLAQHYNYMRQTQKALDVVSEELKRNPTIVDLYVLKAEIYRDAGDVITACRWMDEAQSLDTADRFLNAQCTKFMIQAHRIEDADQMASKFTRGSSTATQYLTEMQCMWFLIENARSYWAMQKYGEALKLCHEIDRAYSTILEDQLDFHSYCLRKGTLRSYVETIRLEDRLRDHPAYFDAASLAIEIYLYLHANPLGDEPDENNQPNADLSSSELKKLRNKQRRAERRAEANREEDKKREQQQNQQHRNREKVEDPENRPPEVEELVPRKLARPADALTEAARFLQPLIDLSSSRIETHCLAYEIYERKGKYLLMTRSIRRGLAMPGARDHPWFNECVCRFLSQMAQLKRETGNLVQDILMEEARAAFGVDADLPSALEYNEDFIKRNSKSFLHVFRGTLTKAVIDPKSSLEHLKKLPSPSCRDFGEVSWQILLEALKLLRTYSSLKLAPVTPELIDKHRAECAALYPLAAVFFSDADLDEHRKAVIAELADTRPTGGGGTPVPNTGDVNAVTEKLESVSLHNDGTAKPEKAAPMVNGHVATGKKASRNRRKKDVNSGQNPAAIAAARA